ncbi:MAG: hypothetical protein P8O93_00120 [Flavobacteriaceae bacterium]|nr:hypothetical protein [Flavobacteriaceae bacterium]MDG1962953.1 hypothetical protein [Flavobacteriaceae bacterium]
MRKFYFSRKTWSIVLIVLLTTFATRAQVGIGTTNPLAMLHIEAPATSDHMTGILLPRVANLPDDSNGTPQQGAVVFYNGTLNGNMKHTFYYYSNGNWYTMTGELAQESNFVPSVGGYDSENGGIVFWVDPNNPYHYKIIALETFGDLSWDEGDCMDGGHNCVKGVDGGLAKTAAWNAAHSGGTSHINYRSYYYDPDGSVDFVGSTPTGWYTPTVDELYEIMSNFSTLNTALSSAGGDSIPDDEDHWSINENLRNGNGNIDTEDSFDEILLLKWKNNDELVEWHSHDKDENVSNRYLRAVKEIGS